MFYKPISIKEAINNINETWFLPAIQRPYDWGERAKKEQFIYKLFDSLVRRYPIGALIIWYTKKKVPFRDFLKDYDSERLAKIRERGLWGKPNKHLVYDGQQRLQSLYSCLKYTFHGKVLCYDMLFDCEADSEPNGFRFFRKHSKIPPRFVRLNTLFACTRKQEAEFEETVLNRILDLDKMGKLLVKKNLKNLWNIFVEEDIKPLAFYPLEKEMSEKEVLDVFVRINTTGMQLTRPEILFAEIKRIRFDFEEQIWGTCVKIKKITNGISVSPDYVLQILHLLIKNTIRVDPERVDEGELKDFVSTWASLKSPLYSFFYDFLYKEFRINHERIIRLKNALIPLIIYMYYMQSFQGCKYRNLQMSSLRRMKKFLVISQLNYWDLQKYIDVFSGIIKHRVCRKTAKRKLSYPFWQMRNFVLMDGRKGYTLRAADFNNQSLRWFILKMLTPNREFQYVDDPDERFNPEIDHIFPLTPQEGKKLPDKYYRWTDTVWNLQPVKGEINGAKLNKPPQEFFAEYPKYLKDYDFLPTKNIKNWIWSDKYAREFIGKRRKKMLTYARTTYGLSIKK